MAFLSKVDPRTHYATREIKNNVGCLHVFDDVLWFSYNTETKSTQFNCPTLAVSFNAFLFTRKIWAWPQQCFQTIFHFREEKADIAVFFWDSGHLYCQFKHSKIFFQPAWFFGAHLIFSTNTGRPRRTDSCLQIVILTRLVSWFSKWYPHFIPTHRQAEHIKDLILFC